jgi:hypothetical protein
LKPTPCATSRRKFCTRFSRFTPEDVLHNAVRGQYGAGELTIKNVPAYRSEQAFAPDSNTETFAALKLSIDNWRWADVPFYSHRKTSAARIRKSSIQFKKAPFMLFRDTPIERLTTNRIVVHIQPDEGITLHFGAKIPGPIVNMGAVDMDFNYVDHFGEHFDRLRTPALRLYDRRRDAFSARRYGRSELGNRLAGSRRLAGDSGARFSELRIGNLGTGGSRRSFWESRKTGALRRNRTDHKPS